MSTMPQARQSRPPSRPPSRTRTRSRSSSRVRSVSLSYEEKPPSPIPPGCICYRPYATVFCKSCGWLLNKARVRQLCPIHVRTLYLLDLDQCPKCRAYPPILTEIQ